MATATKPRRARLERGIYRQPNGRLAVCARHAGRLHFRTWDGDLEAARLDTVAGRWGARFEAMVAAGERHRRTYEAHRFHLDHDLLPRLGHRRIASITVDDIAELRAAGPETHNDPGTAARGRRSMVSLLHCRGVVKRV